MKRRLTSVAAGVATLVAAGGLVLTGAGAASATTYTFEPDPTSVGTLTFYDATGHVITGGTLPSDTTTQQVFAPYVVASTNVHGTDTRATLFYATPDPGPTSAWATESVNGVTTFNPQPAGLPAPLAGIANPIWKGSATDNTLFQWSDPTDGVANTQSGANANIYQVRMYTNNPSAAGSTYDSADVLVDRTAHTWTQVYPTVTNSSVALTASPAGPTHVNGTTFHLHAAVTPSTVLGTVTFFDGASQIGSPVAVASGAADSSTITATNGPHSYTARFDPTPAYHDGAVGTAGSPSSATLNEYKDSTSSTLNDTGVAPADSTSTAVAVTHGATVTDAVHVDATVTDTTTPATSVSSGNVQFQYEVSTDGGTTYGAFTNLGSGTVAVSAGHAVLDLPGGMPYPAGSGPFTYIIRAIYSGTSGSFLGSQGDSAPFTLSAPSVSPVCSGEPNADTAGASCTDTQNIKATVPSGILTITTPYHTGNPLDLGKLVLAGDSHEWAGSASFGDATQGYIRVTDTRSGQPLAWTANALASVLTGPSGTINAQNVGLTLLTVTGTAGSGFNATTGSGGNLAFTDNAAAEPPVLPAASGSAGLGGSTPHVFAHATVGLGTVDIQGLLTIHAPTSTPAGLYTGTITFTVG